MTVTPGPASLDASTLTVSRSRLEGEVSVSGAKNSVLRLLAASLLTSGRIVIDNYPAQLLDAIVHVGMLEKLGKRCVVTGGTLTIDEVTGPPGVLAWEGRSIRNTLLILGALTARTGSGAVPLPGGCDLGDRKHDLHEAVLRALGADVWTENGMLCAHAPGGLRGSEIHLPIRSTGATENAILCGCLARGVTQIWNPHVRPEIIDLIDMLRTMGARIEVHGQERIVVTGREGLSGARHTVIPDSMEAITWLIATTLTGGTVAINNFPAGHLEVPLIFLRESGARIYRSSDSVVVRGGHPFPVEISTGPYPGINSDMQPLFAAFGACATGVSKIVDLRFPNRYAYANEFRKLGVQSSVADGVLSILGGRPLHGARVTALDLRAGIALAMLGLVADGQTIIGNAGQIERGYNGLMGKLKALNACAHLAAA